MGHSKVKPIKELSYKANVKDGAMHVVYRAQMTSDIGLLENGEYELIIRKKKKTVSNPLRRYYFGVVVKMVQAGLKDMGTRLNLDQASEWVKDLMLTLTPEQTHEYLKINFIETVTFDEDTGELVKNKMSTKQMTNTQFMEFYAPIYQWASEFLGITIPEPDPDYKIPKEFRDEIYKNENE